MRKNLFLTLGIGLIVLLLGACATPLVEEEPLDPFLDDPVMEEEMDMEEEMEFEDEMIWDEEEDMDWEEEMDMEEDLEDDEEPVEIQVE